MSTDALGSPLLLAMSKIPISRSHTVQVKFKLRDWLFSRQRYWGEPFPIVFVDGEPRALHESELPVVLPDVDTYQPSGTGESPLATIDSWVQVRDKDTGKDAVRETNTMPQWAGSCWYDTGSNQSYSTIINFCD